MTNEDDDIVKSNCAYLHSHALSFDVYPIYDDQTKLFFTFCEKGPYHIRVHFFCSLKGTTVTSFNTYEFITHKI